MLPGVLPSISFADQPTALPPLSTRLVPRLTATTEGSLSTIPSPRTQTKVLQVPKSIPMSTLNQPRRRSMTTDDSLDNTVDISRRSLARLLDHRHFSADRVNDTGIRPNVCQGSKKKIRLRSS